jgi:twitching motility protein PilT
MEKTKKLLRVTIEKKGDLIECHPDQPPRIRRGAVEIATLPQSLSNDDIFDVVKEVIPEDLVETLIESGKVLFDFTLDGHKITAVVGAVDGEFKIGFRFAPTPAAPPAPAPAAAAPVPPPAPRAPTPVQTLAAPAPAEAAAPVAPPAPRVPKPASPGKGFKPAAIDRLLRMLLDLKGSDLHLGTGVVPHIRASGEVIPLDKEGPISEEQMRALLYEIMPEKNIVQFEENWDSDFAYEIPGVGRFRGNAFMDRDGPGGVFRQIPVEIISAETLGLSKEIQNLCYLSNGLVLVTGPTGSGKSTTLAAMIDLINRNRKDHIITIEDPIEFVHKGKSCIINQREVGTHTKSFKTALKAALREDPDVVLIGEMRDLETIAIAIETAETGHLVFGTLHTSTAPSTVDRLIDQFPADEQSQIRVMLASSLKGVVSQTLCRKIGGGRAAALEVLIVTPAVSNLIREAKIFQIPQIMQTGKQHGMVMLNEALFNLVKAKKVEPKEAYIKAIDKPGLIEMFKQANITLQLEGEVH